MIMPFIKSETIVSGVNAIAPFGQASAFTLTHAEPQRIQLLLRGRSRVHAAAARASGRQMRSLAGRITEPLLVLPFLPPSLLRPLLLGGGRYHGGCRQLSEVMVNLAAPVLQARGPA